MASPTSPPSAPAGRNEIETDVLIVGAGPVGLSLALELGMQGRRCVLVERNDRVGLAPRAKTTNVRTRELLRRWGAADALAEASPFGVAFPSDVVFATRLGGHELARFQNAFYCSPQRDDRFAEHAQWIPQYKVEEVLRRQAASFEGVDIRFDTALVDFTQDGEGVTATLRQGDATHTLRARYLVGADGARSTVREKLGIRMEGVSPLSHSRTVIFRAPGLSAQHALGDAVMYWIVNDEVPGVIAPLDSGDLWTIGWPRDAFPGAEPEELIFKALGFRTEVEVLRQDDWTAHQLVATRYRDGRVFLAGDACHLHPPFGGHGMNMGIGDALDLGWKLGAVMNGWGGATLLDGYQAERRHVHRMVIDEAVANHAYKSSDLLAAGLEDDGPAGDAVRQRVGATILEHKRREFDSLGVVLGGRYDDSPLIVGEPATVDPPPPGSPYVPSARPGGRAPHLWLREGRRQGASLFDHFATDALTLLVTRAGAADAAQQVADAAAELRIPLRLLALDVPGLHALYERDFALIRPDQHVAWRGNDPHAACCALAVAAGRVT